jgi:hypothetical protein
MRANLHSLIKKQMNFLSHFYFTQNKNEPYFSLGSILPDLLRNYNNTWKINPEKETVILFKNPPLKSLLKGWKLHIHVDNQFHSSTSFLQESSTLRKELAPIFTRLPIRPFFLAHVGYELTLDSLLIQNKVVKIDDFYQEIGACDPTVIQEFLIDAGISNPSGFLVFLDSFIKSRYLESYMESKNIVFALDRIGRRVWIEPFNEDEIKESILVFQNLKENIQPTFMEVFKQIEKSIL